MWPVPCRYCEDALRQVIISRGARQHITQRHYPGTGYEERSKFFQNAIPPHTLFGAITNELRSGLQPTQIQETYRQGRRILRYVYYYRFGFIIGVFPNRQGGFSETDTIKIVCNTTECQQCNRRLPSEVVTSFPCYNPFS